jgi:hypothetical protein
MTDRARADRAILDLFKLSLTGQKNGWLTPPASAALQLRAQEIQLLLQPTPTDCNFNWSEADISRLL